MCDRIWGKEKSRLATQGVGTGASGRVVGHTLGDFSQPGKMFEWWGVKNQQRCMRRDLQS